MVYVPLVNFPIKKVLGVGAKEFSYLHKWKLTVKGPVFAPHGRRYVMVAGGGEPQAAAAAHRGGQAVRAPSPAAGGEGDAAAAHVLARARLGAGGGARVVVLVLCKGGKGRREVSAQHVSKRSRNDQLSFAASSEVDAFQLVYVLLSPR